jgi:hypothetical protein
MLSYTYDGVLSMFAGSTAIPTNVRCSEDHFARFLGEIRANYIHTACSSATVCVVRDGRVESTHTGVENLRSKRSYGLVLSVE